MNKEELVTSIKGMMDIIGKDLKRKELSELYNNLFDITRPTKLSKSGIHHSKKTAKLCNMPFFSHVFTKYEDVDKKSLIAIEEFLTKYLEKHNVIEKIKSLLEKVGDGLIVSDDIELTNDSIKLWDLKLAYIRLVSKNGIACKIYKYGNYIETREYKFEFFETNFLGTLLEDIHHYYITHR